MEPPILETIMPSFREKKDLSLEDLAGPVKMMAIPQHGPQKEKNQQKYTITDKNYQNGLHRQIIATTKLTHL